MALILSIETSTYVCSVALHRDGEVMAHQTHQVEKSHSSLLPGLAQDICTEANANLKELSAVAVSAGPGSYTGLRIGTTTAKGLCYSLSIPLIAVDTLDVMIEAVYGKFKGPHYLCPMLDARRMEVYTKIVDQDRQPVRDLQARILDEDSFSEFSKPLYLFGDGMPKFRAIAQQENLLFIDDIYPNAVEMGRLAYEKYRHNSFEDIAYFEPNYLKEWRTTVPKKQLI